MKINKSELQNALERVKPGLASRELIEQTTSFAFMGGRVVTYNDEISISHPVDGLDVTGAVKAQTLYEFLNKIKEEEIEIDWEENQVIIKAGKSKAGLLFEQEIKLPIDEEIGKVGKWKKLPKNFIEALKFCYPCCSTDMSRPVLTCVNIAEKRVEASDSYQIVYHNLDKKIPVPGFLIPATAARELVKYKMTHVAKGENWVHFKTEDNTIFSSRTIANEFPETSQHFKCDGDDFQFPKDIGEVLRRANVFSKSKKETDMVDLPVVEISIDKKKMEVHAKNEHGWFKEEIEMEYDGPPIRFSAGIEFLMDLFSKLQQCKMDNDKIAFSGDGWEHVVAMMVQEEGK